MNDIERMYVLQCKILEEVRKMAVDFSKLDVAVARAVALLNQLAAQVAAIPPSTDPVTQSHIDSLNATLTAAVTADTPASPTGPTGAATGPSGPSGTTGPTGG